MVHQEEEEKVSATPPAVVHLGITCDACGMHPIVGTRYISRRIADYDLCTTCVQDHDAETDFAGFDYVAPHVETRAVRPQPHECIHAYTLSRAAEAIRQNTQATAAHIHYSFGRFEGSETLGLALANDKLLQVLHIHVCFGNTDSEDSIVNIARGISKNTSIQRLTWTIGATGYTVKAALALKEMLTANKTLEACLLRRPCFTKVSQLANPLVDLFASTILEGLKKNKSIGSFGLATSNGLSEETKQVYIETIKENENLLKVLADFEVTDNRIDFLLKCRKNKWVERLSDCNIPPAARVDVLAEAMGYPNVDPVMAAFHLVGHCLDLLKTQEE